MLLVGLAHEIEGRATFGHTWEQANGFDHVRKIAAEVRPDVHDGQAKREHREMRLPSAHFDREVGGVTAQVRLGVNEHDALSLDSDEIRYPAPQHDGLTFPVPDRHPDLVIKQPLPPVPHSPAAGSKTFADRGPCAWPRQS